MTQNKMGKAAEIVAKEKQAQAEFEAKKKAEQDAAARENPAPEQ